MRRIERGSDKRGLSNLVAYVLLISITVSLSVLVYGWLKFYVEVEDVVECSSNVNVVISSYECYGGDDGNLTVRLKNKGLFDIDGFVLRVHDRVDAEFGFYVFDDAGIKISPGGNYTEVYYFNDSDTNVDNLTTITLVDVQPFLVEDGKVSCESYASQKVICS